MKTVMVLLMVAVLLALASAGFFMLHKGGNEPGRGDKSKHMARALALRVALSVALFLFILLGWSMGWVKPGGLPLAP